VASERRKLRKPGRGCLPGFRFLMPRLRLAAGAIPGGEPPGSMIVWRGALAKHTGIIGSRLAGLECVTLSRQGTRAAGAVTLPIAAAGRVERTTTRRARNSGPPASPISPTYPMDTGIRPDSNTCSRGPSGVPDGEIILGIEEEGATWVKNCPVASRCQP
jgi:hypothetical protein